MQKIIDLLKKSIFTIKVRYVDLIWSNLDIKLIKQKVIKSRGASDLELYKNALLSDVVDDSPEEALEHLGKIKTLGVRSVLKRKAYLLARIGKLDEAKLIVKNIGKEFEFEKNINALDSAFTMTKIMKMVVKVYRVHDHFGYLETLIRKHHFKKGAEVGVFMGLHVQHMLEACRNVKLYLIDCYKVIEKTGYDDWDNKKFEELYKSVKQKCDKSKRVRFIRKESLTAAKMFKNGELDFVFLDADHRYGSVKKDLVAWSRKVRVGGVVAGHDYGPPQWPGVKRAVNEWVKKEKKDLFVGKGSFWYFLN